MKQGTSRLHLVFPQNPYPGLNKPCEALRWREKNNSQQRRFKTSCPWKELDSKSCLTDVTAIYPKGWNMPGVGTEAGKSSRRHPHLGIPAWCLTPLTFCWMLEMLDFMVFICRFCLLHAVFSVTFSMCYIYNLTLLKPIAQLWLIMPQTSPGKHIHKTRSPFQYL